jgi:hypothetical protein
VSNLFSVTILQLNLTWDIFLWFSINWPLVKILRIGETMGRGWQGDFPFF